MSAVLEFRNVDILFPGAPDRQAGPRMQRALAALDAGGSRLQISKDTGIVVGVAGANLAIERGEISVLMGLSGSGKSTLLRSANALTPATRGQILIQDDAATVDVANCDAATLRRIRRRRIAMVFQQFGLLPWRTVRENVGFGLELRGDAASDRARIVEEKLALVGLSQWADRFVRELSGGMQQRVGLARAFATDADILLMDEPFSALDPLIRGKLQDELLALQERVKKTIVFVSHDLDEALKLGDRISIMEGGRIVPTGTAQDIVLRPADAYVAEFVRHMNPLTVLTAGMVMRPASSLHADANALWLDEARRYRVELDSLGWPTSASLDGQPIALLVTTGSVPGDKGLCVAPTDLTLQEVIQLRQHSAHPVILTNNERLQGICGDTEIVRALAGVRA